MKWVCLYLLLYSYTYNTVIIAVFCLILFEWIWVMIYFKLKKKHYVVWTINKRDHAFDWNQMTILMWMNIQVLYITTLINTSIKFFVLILFIIFVYASICVIILSQFDWICCNRHQGVCLSVRVRACVCVSVCVCLCLCKCVCVCVIATAQTDGPILMKLCTNHFLWICSIRFSPILKI